MKMKNDHVCIKTQLENIHQVQTILPSDNANRPVVHSDKDTG